MRQMIVNRLEIDFQFNNGMDSKDQSSSIIVRQKQEFYKRLDEFLEKNPQILEAVHEDLQGYSKSVAGKASLGGKSGRKPVYTSENLFRAVIVRKADARQLWDCCDALALRVRRILDFFDNLPPSSFS